MLLKIDSDVCFITNRLKEIDENYFVVYNTHSKKFELHNSGQVHNSYCLSNPYEILDDRFLEYVQKTRSENIDALIEEIDRENEKQQSKHIKEIKEKIGENL